MNTPNIPQPRAEPEALREALNDLWICANTVDGCYTRNPGNFASALRDMRESADRARAALKAQGAPEPRQYGGLPAFPPTAGRPAPQAAIGAEPPKPIAWLIPGLEGHWEDRVTMDGAAARGLSGSVPLYAAPGIGAEPALTDDDLDLMANAVLTDDPVAWWRQFGRAVEFGVRAALSHRSTPKPGEQS